MATMFNICTVCQGLQEIVQSDSRAMIVTQPAWAVTLKAISLALSATADLTLLLTMKLKWNAVKGFIITAFLWTSSSAILFSLVGVVAQQPPPVISPQTWRYTQNYYYGIFAAALYILIAGLLTIYAISVHTVHLTPKDRTSVEDTSIVLRALTLAIFLLGGAAIYVPIEGWSLPDALYWAVYTILTVGIGNIVPKTHLGRSLLFPYATAGITSLGLFISSIASFWTRMGDLHLRFELEHEGIHIHEIVPADQSTTQHEEYELVQHPTTHPRKLNIPKAQQIKLNFHRRRQWLVFIFSAIAWLLLWLVSARIFKGSERNQGWTYFDALYFTFVSLTTIGYGDFYPSSNFGKSFFVFWALLAVPVMTALVGVMGQVGFRAVVYFVRRLGKACPWGYYGRRIRVFLRERRLDMPTGGDSYTGSLSLDAIDIENQQKHPGADYPATSSRMIQHSNLHDPPNSQSRPTRQMESTQYKLLLLCQEIKNIVTLLQDDVRNVDLHRKWVQIIPLLDIEDEEQGCSESIPSVECHHRHRRSHVVGEDTEPYAIFDIMHI
ncbi:hypothetical protein BO78DRAFT_431334 [Aspergillus sclerotiicarbonarius CBS 121057]|uniref:Potassium channel domain-containing protein n=1 Tax=Aspergillus sclerotiicarbonarius (strain CBS 121057 / IBT 28362) TaxID=1448318 RepID=A0A319E8H5_ASPSB|nr:hypothetical protein BO78DRAFT_431334 [Aspergillus sclerotiicarbonarius CBS 121057]